MNIATQDMCIHLSHVLQAIAPKYSNSFCGSFVFFVSCVSHAFASVQCYLVVTCWVRPDLLALVGDVYCIFATFPSGILGQVWYLIVSLPYLCRLSYFHLSTHCMGILEVSLG